LSRPLIVASALLVWKRKDKEVSKKENEVIGQYFAKYMKPRSLVKLEAKTSAKKSVSNQFMDCNDYFSKVITNNLVNNETEMIGYEE
jgi:hypothetical protein